MKERLGREVVMGQSQPPMGAVDQEEAHTAFCATLKADQPTDKFLGIKRACQLNQRRRQRSASYSASVQEAVTQG